jgi:hypothetical protein
MAGTSPAMTAQRKTCHRFPDLNVKQPIAQSPVFSRHDAPEFCEEAPPFDTKGAGKTGCTPHPRSRVQAAQKNAHEHTGLAEAVRPSLRNGFTAYFVLSPVIGFLATVHPREALSFSRT